MRKLLVRAVNSLKIARYWAVAQVSIGVLRLLRLLPPDRAMDLAERAARRIGPLTGRHRVAIGNLRGAYPEMPGAEIEAIAGDMWANMARLGCEYIFLDRLFDYDPEAPAPGRVEIAEETVARFRKLRDGRKPAMFFTGHLGNFEFLPIAAAAFDLDITSMFRPPNNPYLAAYVLRKRTNAMGGLIASRAGVAFTVARILERGGNVGVLVDQKFIHGVPTTFFGRPCETSPLVAKLSRNTGCDVYPARCMRLPGGRYRLELEERMDLVRGADGTVDVKATTQRINDTVERWVREDPGQWMWFHRRWEIAPRQPKRGTMPHPP